MRVRQIAEIASACAPAEFSPVADIAWTDDYEVTECELSSDSEGIENSHDEKDQARTLL